MDFKKWIGYLFDFKCINFNGFSGSHDDQNLRLDN